MDRLLFFFITGALSSLFWPALLPIWSIPPLLLWFFLCFKKHWLVATGSCAGLIWMLSVGYWLELAQPNESLFSHRILITGEITSIVTDFDEGKFDFITEQVLPKNQHIWQEQRHKLRLSWRNPNFPLAQGQKLQLEVKLKPRWGLANEAGFDYQQWQLSKNIVASGYVVDSCNNLLIKQGFTWRQSLATHLALVHAPEIRWLLALGIGYRGALQDSDWQLLQRTGTAHLVAISGMHLGIVALWSYVLLVLLFGLVRGFFDCNWLPDIRFAAVSATLVPCWFYALLAGFSIPTMRALLMLAIAWCILILRLNWCFHRFILVSIAAFVLAFPLSIFSMSFWLSFFAILCIAFLLWRFPMSNTSKDNISRRYAGKVGYFLKMQLGVTVLMIPLVLLFFGGTSLISPLVNIIAVPLVTLVLLPMSLVVILLIVADSQLVYLVLDSLLRILLEAELGLRWASELSFAWLDVGISEFWPMLLASLGLLLLSLPAGLIPRGFYLAFLLPLASGFYQKDARHWQLDVLDVGQGLSVLLRKDGHAILYDTGAAFPSGFSMAEAVILPVLKKSNIPYLDKLLISHDDNDHAGGTNIILAHLPVAEYRHSPVGCHADTDFSWRGLQFDILWPDADYPELQEADNDLSCVIRISDGVNSVLLAGDIEYSVERLLVHLHRQKHINLRSDYLVVPHHGSKTSSTTSFISAVSPQYALVSAGFRNRWRMPAQEVVKRYEIAGVKVLNTAATGQIGLIFAPEEKPVVTGWRINHHLRWYLRPW